MGFENLQGTLGLSKERHLFSGELSACRISVKIQKSTPLRKVKVSYSDGNINNGEGVLQMSASPFA